MTQTLSVLLPILHILASTGAGVLASGLFLFLRARFPLPAAVPVSPTVRLFLHLLYAPRWSRVSVLVMAALIALPCAVLAGLIEGHALLPVVDALLAALISQIWHALTALSGDVVIEIPTVDEEPMETWVDLKNWLEQHGWESADQSDERAQE